MLRLMVYGGPMGVEGQLNGSTSIAHHRHHPSGIILCDCTCICGVLLIQKGRCGYSGSSSSSFGEFGEYTGLLGE